MIDYHGRFVWYELLTTDVAAATAFYAKVMGWGTQDASAPGQPYTLLTVGRAAACGVMGLSEELTRMGVMPRWLGYVGVNDVDAATERLSRLGGAVRVPPTNVPDISRFAVVADPQAAPLVLVKWRRPDQHPLVERGEPRRVGWHELLAADAESAFAFYRELFNWQRDYTDLDAMGGYQRFSVDGRTIGGICDKPATVPEPFWLFYFNIGDIEAAAERVKAGGGQIVEGPFETPGGNTVARCTDPQGAMFALEGKGRGNAVGYFERAASPSRSAT
jgi:uncharacterized protein